MKKYLIFRITQELHDLTNQGNYFIGPVELVIDVPFYIGCFEETDDISTVGTPIDIPDSNSPTNCLSICAKTNPLQRYACKFWKVSIERKLKGYFWIKLVE